MSETTPKKSIQDGFSIIELVLVVVIVGILSAVAVPSLAKAKRAAEEGAVIGNLRTFSTYQMNYFSINGRYARVAELNTFTNNALGTTSSRSIYRGEYRYRNYPSSNPTDASLKTTYGFRVTRTERSRIVFEVLFRSDVDGEIIVVDD